MQNTWIENNNKTIKRIIASLIETFFVTNGLWEVRLTLLSRLISMISLIIQPALRIKKDPNKKKMYHFKRFNWFIEREASPNQHGHIKRVKPIGLLKRIKSRNDLILLGRDVSNIV